MFWRWRMKVFLIGATLASFGSGFHEIGNALKYHHPIQMTLAQFEQAHPDAGWYQITDATLDVANSIPKEGTTSGYYVPLKVPGVVSATAGVAAFGGSTPGQTSTGSSASTISPQAPSPPPVIVYITDSDMIKQLDAYNNSVNRPMTAEGNLHSSDLKNITVQSSIPVQVSGMVLTEDSQRDDDMEDLHAKLGTDESLLLIGLGRHPNGFMGMVFLGGGVLLALGTLWSFGVQPSVSGIKETINQARGGGYSQPVSGAYQTQLPSAYTNNQWQQNNQSQYPPSYSGQSQQNQPYPPANTPSNAWSPNPQNSSYQQPNQAPPTYPGYGQQTQPYPPAMTPSNAWSPTPQADPYQQQGPAEPPAQWDSSANKTEEGSEPKGSFDWRNGK